MNDVPRDAEDLGDEEEDSPLAIDTKGGSQQARDEHIVPDTEFYEEEDLNPGERHIGASEPTEKVSVEEAKAPEQPQGESQAPVSAPADTPVSEPVSAPVETQTLAPEKSLGSVLTVENDTTSPHAKPELTADELKEIEELNKET